MANAQTYCVDLKLFDVLLEDLHVRTQIRSVPSQFLFSAASELIMLLLMLGLSVLRCNAATRLILIFIYHLQMKSHKNRKLVKLQFL